MTFYDSLKTYQVSCLTAAGASVYCGEDSEVGRVSLEARQEKVCWSRRAKNGIRTEANSGTAGEKYRTRLDKSPNRLSCQGLFRSLILSLTPTTMSSFAPHQSDDVAIATIRTLAVDIVGKANSGHPGT